MRTKSQKEIQLCTTLKSGTLQGDLCMIFSLIFIKLIYLILLFPF